MEVKNLTIEANVTSFQMSCPDADVNIDPDSLASVPRFTASKSSTEVRLSFTALPGMKRLSFLFQYAGINPTCQISITESITLAVKQVLEVKSVVLKPVFKYDWFQDLRRWDPSLSQSHSLFSQSDEDDGVTDSKYCLLSISVKNCIPENIAVDARVTNPSGEQMQLVDVHPEQEVVVTIPVEKTDETSAQRVVDTRVRVCWRVGDRSGSLGPLHINPSEAVHMVPSPVRFHYSCSPVSLHSFAQLTVTAVSQTSLKGYYLYLYRYKEYRGRISLKPEQLVLSGSLVTTFPEDSTEATLTVKFCILEEGQYGFVAACGTRKRMASWASEALRVALPVGR